MRLPRMTVRRWLIAVAVVGGVLFMPHFVVTTLENRPSRHADVLRDGEDVVVYDSVMIPTWHGDQELPAGTRAEVTDDPGASSGDRSPYRPVRLRTHPYLDNLTLARHHLRRRRDDTTSWSALLSRWFRGWFPSRPDCAGCHGFPPRNPRAGRTSAVHGFRGRNL